MLQVPAGFEVLAVKRNENKNSWQDSQKKRLKKIAKDSLNTIWVNLDTLKDESFCLLERLNLYFEGLVQSAVCSFHFYHLMENDEQKEYAFRRGDIMQRSELPAARQVQQSPQQTAKNADW